MPGSNRAQWGWHRLTDGYAEEIVKATRIAPGELVLDVGAGNGALTAPLAALGARVIAIELHPDRARLLRARFDGDHRVKVVRADAADLWLPRKPFHVVSNPPFSITTSLLERLVSAASQMTSAHLVLQRSAARRLVADINNRYRTRYTARVERLLPRSAFNPRPKVDCAVLVVDRLSMINRKRKR